MRGQKTISRYCNFKSSKYLLPRLRICLHYIGTDPDPTLTKKFRSDYRIQIPGLKTSVVKPDLPDPHVLGLPDSDPLLRAFYFEKLCKSTFKK
jgi:hypothetical protein